MLEDAARMAPGFIEDFAETPPPRRKGRVALWFEAIVVALGWTRRAG